MSEMIKKINKNKKLDVYQKQDVKMDLIKHALDDLVKSDDSNKNLAQITKEINAYKEYSIKIFCRRASLMMAVAENHKYKELYKTFEDWCQKGIGMSETKVRNTIAVYEYFFLNKKYNGESYLLVDDLTVQYSKLREAIPVLSDTKIPEYKKDQIREKVLMDSQKKSRREIIKYLDTVKDELKVTAEEKIDKAKKMLEEMAGTKIGEYTEKQKEADKFFNNKPAPKKERNNLIVYWEEVKEYIENKTKPDIFNYLDNDDDKETVKNYIEFFENIAESLKKYL